LTRHWILPATLLISLLVTPFRVNGAGLTVSSLPGDPAQPGFVCHSGTGAFGPCLLDPALQVNRMVWVGTDGTGDYVSIQAALDDIPSWCGTPGLFNQCLVQLGPGVHDVGATSLQMVDYVSIHGAGIETTIIKGSNSGTTGGVVNLASADLESLTVRNVSSASGSHVVVFASSGSPNLREVGIRCQNSYTCYGIYNNGAYFLTLERVEIVSSSSINDTTDDAYGIYNVSGDFVDIIDSSISVSDAADRRYGLRNNGQTTVNVRNTEIIIGPQTGSAPGSWHMGIYNFNSDLKLVAVDINMLGGSGVGKVEGLHHGSSGGNDSAKIYRSTIFIGNAIGEYAVHFSGTGTYEISNSRISSMGTSTGANAPSVTVVNSTISSGVLAGDSTKHYCGSVYKTFPLVLLDSDCQP